jgi:hypothetical protein
MLQHSHVWRRLPLGVLVIALAGCQDGPEPLGVDTPSFSQGQTKTAVCHYDADAGTYHKITIADPGLPAHIEHGDLMPGEAFPNQSGYLDDSCMPMAYALGSPSYNTAVYGGAGGGETTVSCPAGSVNVGMEGFHGYYTSHAGWRYWIGQVRLRCAALQGDGSLGAASTTVNFASGTSFSSNVPFGATCDAGGMLVGGSGEHATYVSRVGGNCASAFRIASQAGGYDSSIGEFGTPITSSETPTQFVASCNAGYVSTGITGRAGWLVDAVGFVCTPLLRQPL